MPRNRIKQVRHLRGLTQTDLARRARLTQATISELETGEVQRPSLSTIRRLCRALDATLDQLFPDGRKRPKAEAIR